MGQNASVGYANEVCIPTLYSAVLWFPTIFTRNALSSSNQYKLLRLSHTVSAACIIPSRSSVSTILNVANAAQINPSTVINSSYRQGSSIPFTFLWGAFGPFAWSLLPTYAVAPMSGHEQQTLDIALYNFLHRRYTPYRRLKHHSTRRLVARCQHKPIWPLCRRSNLIFFSMGPKLVFNLAAFLVLHVVFSFGGHLGFTTCRTQAPRSSPCPVRPSWFFLHHVQRRRSSFQLSQTWSYQAQRRIEQ